MVAIEGLTGKEPRRGVVVGALDGVDDEGAGCGVRDGARRRVTRRHRVRVHLAAGGGGGGPRSGVEVVATKRRRARGFGEAGEPTKRGGCFQRPARVEPRRRAARVS